MCVCVSSCLNLTISSERPWRGSLGSPGGKKVSPGEPKGSLGSPGGN